MYKSGNDLLLTAGLQDHVAWRLGLNNNLVHVNTLRLRKYGCQFADDIFYFIFLYDFFF